MADRPSHSERAYAKLLEAIATCKLRPGSLLNERDTAAGLGMSRTPFRQALHRLALEGLVVTIPKRGVYVTALDRKVIADNVAVREALEVEIVRRIIDGGLPVDLPRLRDLLATMRAAAAKGDARAFLAADERFHLAIVGASQNQPALQAVKRTWIYLNRARYLAPPGHRARREALAEHREIAAALGARERARAERAVRRHLKKSLRRLDEIAVQMPSAFTAGASPAGNTADPPGRKTLQARRAAVRSGIPERPTTRRGAGA